ncbi:MAG TPA: GPW/gp25 family protein [Usitatibacter sp.]|nr:GPW/gp25 family protein [Usitatibacter sp.]
MIIGNGALYGSGMSFPPRVGSDGRIVWSQGEQNVRESIRVILKTESGERLRSPDFGAGLARYLFEPNNAATQSLIANGIQASLARWEPRIAVESVDVAADAGDPESAIATITYRLVASQKRERVSVNVSLAAR